MFVEQQHEQTKKTEEMHRGWRVSQLGSTSSVLTEIDFIIRYNEYMIEKKIMKKTNNNDG